MTAAVAVLFGRPLSLREYCASHAVDFCAGSLTLLLECFVVRASGFMAVTMHDPATPPRKRALQVGAINLGSGLSVIRRTVCARLQSLVDAVVLRMALLRQA